MKKIIAIFLLIALVMALAACKDDTGDNTGDNNTGDSVGDSTGNTGIAAKIDEMYARSAPTKTVTTIENSLAGVILTDKMTLISGKIDGVLAAAVLTETTERIRSIESGSGAKVEEYIDKSTTVTEYLEGMGTRVNGGAWDESGENFAPTKASIAMKVTNAAMTNVRVRSDSYAFTVPAASTEEVFGAQIASDVEVVLSHDGASVVSVSLKYVIPADAEKSMPETIVKIFIEYYYDAQVITSK